MRAFWLLPAIFAVLVIASAQAQRVSPSAPSMGGMGGFKLHTPKTSVGDYFNPKEMTVDKPIPWQKHKGRKRDPVESGVIRKAKRLPCPPHCGGKP